jgi:outer membrane protein OmpA-like peptidoglycan-associated protein
MVSLKQVLVMAGILLVGCTSQPAVERPNPAERQIGAMGTGWIRPSWRICEEGGTCPQPTRKTIALASQSPIQATPRPELKPQAEEVERTPLTVHFGFAKARPTPTGRVELEKVLSQIRENDSIQIQGHTDDIGHTAFNDRLARQRARFVAAWLKRRGIANPMKIEARGKCCYVAANDSDEGRAANRRVVIVLKARQNPSGEKSNHNRKKGA